jgi:hypothetical protein
MLCLIGRYRTSQDGDVGEVKRPFGHLRILSRWWAMLLILRASRLLSTVDVRVDKELMKTQSAPAKYENITENNQ